MGCRKGDLQWSVNKFEAELAESPAVLSTLAQRGDKAAVLLMLLGGYSLWISGAGDNVLEIDVWVE